MAPTLKDVLHRIANENIENVRFEFLDTNGIARSKTIPARHFKKTAEHGILFPLAFYYMDALADLAMESEIAKRYLYTDLKMFPDLSTFTTLPWAGNTGRVYVSGTRVSANEDEVLVDPRVILQKQIQALTERGLSILAAFEYEFWVVDDKSREPITGDINCLSTVRLAKHREFFDKIVRSLYGAGVDIGGVETEYARGQFEIKTEPAFGICAADDAATLRTGIKEMAIQEGLLASFMSKPYEDENGIGAHLNHSLWSADGKTAKTNDPSRRYGLSEVAENWVAGLMAHAPALSFLQAPTLSCRERYKPGSLAPFNATWGIDNRTCSVRIKVEGSKGGYVENRIGSAAANPYISLAATIAAGLDGIDRRLPLSPPLPFNKASREEDGAAILPTTLESAIETLKGDVVMKEAIGPHLINAIEQIRLLEQGKVTSDKYESHRKLYFEYI